MTRFFARLCLLVASLALVLAAAPQIASAQDADADADVVVEDNADANADGVVGADEDHRTFVYDPDGGGSYFIVPDAQPGSGDTGNDNAAGGTGGGDAGVGLAVTGTEVEPIAAISIGLLALGGSVLVTSRRRLSLFS